MSDTDPPDKIEFFKDLMKDETVLNLIKEVNKMRVECGDNGDNFMSYLLGAMANLFSKPENAIACLEAVKFSLIMKGISVSASIVSDEIRQKEPEKMTVA